jgi:hypothetical protein
VATPNNRLRKPIVLHRRSSEPVFRGRGLMVARSGRKCYTVGVMKASKARRSAGESGKCR